MKTLIRVSLVLGLTILIIACQTTPNKTPIDNKESTQKVIPEPLWELDTKNSRITYISTKNSDIEEHNTLRFTSGSIDIDKKVELLIDLDSIDTSIDIRNQRMRELFFETDKYPTAKVTAKIENDLPLMTPYVIKFKLKLKKQSHSFLSPVIIHSGGSEMMVTNDEPVVISAKNYGLKSALNKLREIAGLESIDPKVQVTFKLIFKQIN